MAMQKSQLGLPLTDIFGSAEAKVLDQSLIVGNMKQTISMLAESTDLSPDVVDAAVKKLVSLHLMYVLKHAEGKPPTYCFNLGELNGLIQWATVYQLQRRD
jgi:hypothetical protein